MKNTKNNPPIEVNITQETNGYIIKVGHNCEPKTILVFQTFCEMASFFACHFDFRDDNISIDNSLLNNSIFINEKYK